MATVIRGDDNFDTSIGANVVQTHVTDTSSQAISNTEINITNMTATITPSSVSSRILVAVRWCGETSVSEHDFGFGMRRDGTDIGKPPVAGTRRTTLALSSLNYHSTDYGSTASQASYSYLDSPNTTSAVTYTATVQTSEINQTIFNNRTVNDTNNVAHERLTSSIILTEVQG
tara:strand:- start:80 stop:598 length:519 start_codon:yes stop_codon:yes gene_type:complete